MRLSTLDIVIHIAVYKVRHVLWLAATPGKTLDEDALSHDFWLGVGKTEPYRVIKED